MFRPEVKTQIAGELARGELARSQGFEGRARVCARRAAGMAVRAYLEQNNLEASGPSAMDLLDYLRGLPGVPEEARQICDHLQARVDEAFTLPAELDLLAEAQRLAKILEELS